MLHLELVTVEPVRTTNNPRNRSVSLHRGLAQQMTPSFLPVSKKRGGRKPNS